jgi:hypothetical protein
VYEGFPRLWIEDQGDAALALDPFERKLVVGFGSHEHPHSFVVYRLVASPSYS